MKESSRTSTAPHQRRLLRFAEAAKASIAANQDLIESKEGHCSDVCLATWELLEEGAEGRVRALPWVPAGEVPDGAFLVGRR